MSLEFENGLADLEQKITELKRLNEDPKVHFNSEITALKRKLNSALKRVYTELTPWQTVQVARHPQRPGFKDYVNGMFSEFIELHGDRCFGDDKALLGGLATLGGQRCMLLGMDKGKTVEEKVVANFGMANPEGYRKALRLMRLAEKFRIPIVCLVDTPAAYPGREAEERGQAEAIARNLTEMASLTVPIVVMITGEGGSGGALGIAVGDAILMLSMSVYSVIPPEGCAAILWRDADKAPQAAEALRVTAPSLLEMGIIDEVIDEPLGGAHRDHDATFKAASEAILRHIKRLRRLPHKKLTDRRFNKFAKIGKFDSRKYAAH